MSVGTGPPRLRNRFDEARHPPAQGAPWTHHREFYLATDGSVRGDGGRLGAIVETIDGVRVGSWSRPAAVVDNNDAELKALHWGLDLLAARSPPRVNLGVLLDHDHLADSVAAVAGGRGVAVPPIASASPHHWGGILARLSRFESVGVGVVAADENPAHGVANRGDWDPSPRRNRRSHPGR